MLATIGALPWILELSGSEIRCDRPVVELLAGSIG
jgi:hypothetical protein